MTQTKAELLQTRHQGDIRLGDADSTHYVGFKAPATVGTSLVWTLPATDGTAGYYLKTDGSGNLGWSLDNSGVSLSGSTNNTIATVTGANALQGEAKLTFDGNHVVQTISASGEGARFIAAGNHYPEIRLNANRTSAGNSVGHILGQWNGTDIAAISFIAGADTTNKDDGEIKFNTRLSGAGITERMRIASSGNIGIGLTNPQRTLHLSSNNTVIALTDTAASTDQKTKYMLSDAGIFAIGKLNDAYDTAVEHLRIDNSGKVGIGENSPSYQLDVKGDTGATFSAGSNSTAGLITISGRNSGGSGSALSRLKSYPDGSSNQSHFAIETRNSSASMVEAMRITSAQKVLIGTTTEGSPAADNLTIADSGDCGLTIRAGTSASGQIYFSDATSGDDEYDGAIEWSHSTQVMKFYADSGERFRIASSGQIGIGGANYGTSGQVLTSGGSGAAPSWATASGGGPGTGEMYVKLTNGASASDTGTNTFSGAYAGTTLASGAANNTFIGQYAGNETSTGDDNVAIGKSAFQQMQTGNKNIAIGSQAGQALKATDSNIAIGYWTFKQNLQGSTPTADGSIAIGFKALYRCTHGSRNIAIGQECTASSQTGSYNTGIGNGCQLSLSSGTYNSSYGANAGGEITTGSNNLMLGNNAGRYNAPSGNVSTASNILCLGNNSISNFYCADTSISSSDKRDKTDVTDFTYGLSWVNKLKPVTYRWDKRIWYNEYNEDGSLKTEVTPDGTKKRARQHIGFLAQDVLAVEQADGFASKKDDMLVVNLNEDDTAYGLKYERLVPVLVNAIKELSTEVNTLKTKVAALEAA
jgi:hypothetical protein